MDNEKFVRSVYQIAEDTDIPGFIALFTDFDCYPSGSVILTQLGVLGHLDAALER
jgi:hypothetical protein